VDIRSETEFAEEEAEMGYQEEEVSGRCAAILANGKRCPNASLPGSRYCGLPAHQALEGTGTDYLVPPEDEGEEEPAEEAAGNGAEEPVVDGAAEGAAEPAAEASVEASSSENGDLPVEELVEPAAVEDAPVEEAPVATTDEVVTDGVAEVEAAQENEAIDAGEAPPSDEAAAEGTDES
jgi:transcription termination/antitermination protein NusA